MSEGGEDVADPDGDSICGFALVEEASAVRSGVGEEEVQEIAVLDSH